ncbi:hypothetical protein ZIOFF_034984 [Zingiber officinale]|uniref:Uncharacterized protein n=2 Tax=Zingiber officinale TaxID=94328 RepID=A0A8J5G8R6_ZINOF|nr:hypothetical protein ZIOFF_034984 [Zingiber officinale]
MTCVPMRPSTTFSRSKKMCMHCLIEEEGIVLMPGIFDALFAGVLQISRFKARFVFGYVISTSRLGMPRHRSHSQDPDHPRQTKVELAVLSEAKMERSSTKTHLVCMALPLQGHINSMLNLAKVLHFKGFFITFVNTDYAHRQLLGSLSALDDLPDFRFASISDAPDDSDQLYRQDARNRVLAAQKNCPASFLRLISALNDPSISGVPPVRCVISDSFATFTLNATTELGIPNVFYCTVAVCGFTDLYYSKDLIERGLVPLKSEDDLTNGYLDTLIDWIPGMVTVRLRDLTSFIRTTDRDDASLNFSMDGARASHRATAIIFNTFSELESPLLSACSSMLPAPVFDIGPMCLLSQHIPDDSSTSSIGGLNMRREDSRCMEWLDEKESGSVLYVNFGSLTSLTSEQAVEFGWGLANSGCAFLWVIRPDRGKELLHELVPTTEGVGSCCNWRFLDALRMEFYDGKHMLRGSHDLLAFLCRSAN